MLCHCRKTAHFCQIGSDFVSINRKLLLFLHVEFKIMEYRALPQEEYDDIQSRILYEDNHILIINKHVGEIIQGDKTGDETLADKLKAFIAVRDNKPGKVFMGIPHRLDRPVSGIAIFAKTTKALERLTEMFRNGEVHKTYWALCCEQPKPEEGELVNMLVRNEKMNKSFIADRPDSNAKEAKLRYKLIGHTERYFLVEVELLTGRHHQIRCQLAGIGCHIKGDLKYGAPRSNRDGGICLHSRRVSFMHPVKKQEINITAPVPQDWKGVENFE
jgi:23S rRNA pseudouridine1911/1915/1917 synthase